jgi:tetratricopeptide (TPR) repeat protein
MTSCFRNLATLALLLFALGANAQNNDLAEISKLLRSGQHTQALDRVNQYLASRPKDAQGRFLKGLILTEQNKTSEAIELLVALTKDYPELPEPYNNLAVLYASQGQYERARQALEQSIRTHPAYATAYENLGDVYTKLASQAYDKALQLDSSNTTAQTKLALMRDLVSSGVRPPKPAAAPAKAEVVAQAPTKAAEPAKAAAPEPKPAAAAPSEPKPAAKSDEGADEVVKTVRAWAKAWSSKDVPGYLAFYGSGFKTPNGESRSAWEADRRARINAPSFIDVQVDSPKTTLRDNTATVVFRQSYKSDKLNVSSLKTLSMAKSNGKWLIVQERSGN